MAAARQISVDEQGRASRREPEGNDDGSGAWSVAGLAPNWD